MSRISAGSRDINYAGTFLEVVGICHYVCDCESEDTIIWRLSDNIVNIILAATALPLGCQRSLAR